jgi:pentatricopeptide repeat protein
MPPELQGAEEVLGRMASEGMLVQPNVVTYSSLINAYANKGNSDGAESVLSRMQSR